MAKGGKNGGGKPGGGGGGSDGSSISGNRKDNLLVGTELEDTILAREGNDTLTGLAGDDFLYAEEGDDSLDGGSGNDRLFGMSGEDVMNGGDDNDELFGGSGNDYLDGGGGDDILQGGLGSDTIYGGGGYDTAEFTDIGGYIPLSSDPNVVTVDGITLMATGANSYTSWNETASEAVDFDTLINISRIIGSNYNDSMTGGNGANNFSGAQGDDILSGGAGSDTLYGGLDKDTLEGGSGSDTFVFVRVADGILEPNPAVPGDTNVYDDPGTGDGEDVIVDFDKTEDTILFLTNEQMTIDSYENEDGFTVLTYAAPDFLFGPSEVTLTGETDGAADLLTSGAIEILVDSTFEFIL